MVSSKRNIFKISVEVNLKHDKKDGYLIVIHNLFFSEFNTSCSNNKPLEIPQTLENYLQFVAKSGNTVFPWPQVRNLVRYASCWAFYRVVLHEKLQY